MLSAPDFLFKIHAKNKLENVAINNIIAFFQLLFRNMTLVDTIKFT